MKPNLPVRRMREHPDLEQLKRQAKELLRDFSAGDPAAITEVNGRYRGADPATFALHHAQLVIARSYGFESWPKLSAYVDGVTVRRFADAIRAGDLAQVEAMLRARPEIADMQISYGDEHRPIHFAVMARSAEMTRLLMRRGANARYGIHPHRDATTPWRIAKERGYGEIVAIIEEEERRRPAGTEEDTPESAAPAGDEAARSAVASGDIEWIRARHDEGTLTNPVRWRDGGLLTVAVEHDQLAALRLLLDCGLDPDERVSEREGDWVAYSQGYPLWHAAALDKREMAELLLARGANPNVHVDSSGSAVYSAYSHKQWEMVELLRRHGGIVTADIASTYRQADLVRQMLADRGRVVAEEMLRFAVNGGGPEIVRMVLQLIDWPADDPRWAGILGEPLCFWHHIPWLYAGNREFDRAGYLECFRLVLARCGPNHIGSFSRTALHDVAAMREWITDEEVTPFAIALLDAGARMDVRDTILKSTPLGWACRWGRAGVVRAMLAHGADPVEAEAEEWARPRAWAAKMGHAEIVKML
ncbi:MAG TPA: ankyrin repeat domain-containing protein [Candidatus Solibacter sp.]|nr:ankyrin repeat domain-containing protein [Candidatus Solibacter sp.]